MKTWKGYNLLDLFLVLSGVIVLVVSGILLGSEWYIIINTILGILCVFTQAKGKVSTQFIGIVYFCFYIFICYKQKYFGEAILYLAIMLPMYVYGAIHWLSHREKQDNFVLVRNNLPKKEWIIMFVSLAAISVAVYFVLKLLGTAKLLTNTISFVSMLPAVYLLMRRCKWNNVAFLINDFFVPVLWLFLVIEGDWSFLPMVIYFVFQLTYDIYGIINWIKLEKRQKQTGLIN